MMPCESCPTIGWRRRCGASRGSPLLLAPRRRRTERGRCLRGDRLGLSAWRLLPSSVWSGFGSIGPGERPRIFAPYGRPNARPAVELHAICAPARDHAEAVVLDLVQPLLSRARLLGRCGQAWRNEARRANGGA